jgi:2',3'-cyclic-nucleotide 2'-phosphodiesterase (5'-nucleotidase family)
MKPLAYSIICVLILVACKSHYSLQSSAASHRDLKKENASSSAEKIIAPYKQQLGAQMQDIIAESNGAFTKEGNETTLGNFVCDAMRFIHDSLKAISEPPLIIMNRGGLRTNLPPGKITVNHIFELMPFDNELVFVKVDGEKIKQAMKLIIEKRHGFKHASINIQASDTLIKINGTLPDVNKSYWLLTSDYLANGGDGFSCLKNPLEKIALQLKLRDAIILYCKRLTRQQQLLIPYTDGRLTLQ